MRRLLPLACLLLSFAIVAPATWAQIGVEIHRLEIREGRVFHDGVELPASALPDDFDAAGLTVTFEYSGPVMPAITLNGQVFALEGDRLVTLDGASEQDGTRVMAMMSADSGSEDERRHQAEQVYLQTLSERDRALYERLIKEREMEDEILRLAYAARRAAEPAERDRLRHRLHDQLSEMFDLKQVNRQEEIRQVEVLLDAMRRQVEERETRRDAIIRQRLVELAGDN